MSEENANDQQTESKRYKKLDSIFTIVFILSSIGMGVFSFISNYVLALVFAILMFISAIFPIKK
jgi:hypothetical protein